MMKQSDIEKFIADFEVSHSKQRLPISDNTKSIGSNTATNDSDCKRHKRKLSEINNSQIVPAKIRKKGLLDFTHDSNYSSSSLVISLKLPPEIYKKNSKLFRVDNFLPPKVASSLSKYLDLLPESEWETSSSEVDAKMFNYSTGAGSTQHTFSVTGAIVLDPATCFEKFHNERSTVIDKFFCILCNGIYLHQQQQVTSSNASSTTKAAKTNTDTCKFTLQCGRYTEGHYIEPHDDSAIEEIDGEIYHRELAIVIYLTKSWAFENGGLFIDLELNPPVPYVPTFNTLIAFHVPRLHQVTPVGIDSFDLVARLMSQRTVLKAGQAAEPKLKRYSIFGWKLKRAGYNKIPVKNLK